MNNFNTIFHRNNSHKIKDYVCFHNINTSYDINYYYKPKQQTLKTLIDQFKNGIKLRVFGSNGVF